MRPITTSILVLALGGCLPTPPDLQRPPSEERGARPEHTTGREEPSEGAPRITQSGIPWQQARIALAAELAERGIEDDALLEAVREVPRHRFLPENLAPYAYQDVPLTIGGHAVREPYVLAAMIERAHVRPGDKALAIGADAGYAGALLAALGADVVAIETAPDQTRRERAAIEELGYASDVRLTTGGEHQARAHAPYDVIIATAPIETVPMSLRDQLAPRGRLVMAEGRPVTERVVVVTGQRSTEVAMRGPDEDRARVRSYGTLTPEPTDRSRGREAPAEGGAALARAGD